MNTTVQRQEVLIQLIYIFRMNVPQMSILFLSESFVEVLSIHLHVLSPENKI